MIDVFLGPMFDSRPDILGLPLAALIAGLAFVVMVAGLIWFRRITDVEPDQRSFRATTRAEPTLIAARIGIVAFAAIALLVFVAGR